LKVISLFSGCGGLDLGFQNAGFNIVYANDIDRSIWETYEKNHKLAIDGRSIRDVPSQEIPDADGIIGGPPCQSWSLAGAMRGANDERGQLFYEYTRVLRDKKPKFFLAENVPGIISRTHLPEFNKILSIFASLGYKISYQLLDARDYGVPQERKRVVVVGYRSDLGKSFVFPSPTHSIHGGVSADGKELREWVSLKKAIGDLPEAVPALPKNKTNGVLAIQNHEYMNGGFSTIYMSRNRRRSWNEPSFTIQAGGRHAPLHPDSPKMIKLGEDEWKFEGDRTDYRRMSVREAARIQTFPDDFILHYTNIADGYKMIGNAVPVKLAEAIARKIKEDLA
jgi:DNA (cytosine-5)-methyltransferase 1